MPYSDALVFGLIAVGLVLAAIGALGNGGRP